MTRISLIKSRRISTCSAATSRMISRSSVGSSVSRSSRSDVKRQLLTHVSPAMSDQRNQFAVDVAVEGIRSVASGCGPRSTPNSERSIKNSTSASTPRSTYQGTGSLRDSARSASCTQTPVRRESTAPERIRHSMSATVAAQLHHTDRRAGQHPADDEVVRQRGQDAVASGLSFPLLFRRSLRNGRGVRSGAHPRHTSKSRSRRKCCTEMPKCSARC